MSFPYQMKESDRQEGPQVLAIGDFDGVHLGHQDVIRHAVAAGRDAHVPVSIMTFHPHPREILGQPKYTQYLTPNAEKLKLFEQLGIDHVYIVSFDADLAQVTPEQFIEQMLIPMDLVRIIVGFDFTFGHQGRGTVETLTQYCADRISVIGVDPFMIEGKKVSSTYIREMLEEGNVLKASELLGHPYSVYGLVVTGDGRGKTIGFPTANLSIEEPFVIPRHGVYAVKAELHGQVYRGIMNIGVKPTFVNLGKPTLEVHLLDFSDSIYGETLRVDFMTYIRSERKFASVTELVEQIGRDRISAEQYFQEHGIL